MCDALDQCANGTFFLFFFFGFGFVLFLFLLVPCSLGKEVVAETRRNSITGMQEFIAFWPRRLCLNAPL